MIRIRSMKDETGDMPMLSHQKLQNTLDEIKEITKIDMLLYNSKGKEVAATMQADIPLESVVCDFCHSMAEQQT